jgi:transposase
MTRNQENAVRALLGSKDYRVGETWGGEEKVTVETEVRGRRKCPHCGSSKLYKHGRVKAEGSALHLQQRQKKVYLQLRRSGWRCLDCGHTFIEGLELVRSCSRLTKQAEAEMLWQLRHRNFSQVSREVQTGYGTLRCLLERQMDQQAPGFI